MRDCFHMWVVDDRRENVEMIERSIPGDVASSLAVRSFTAAEEFLACLENACRENPPGVPDFVLLDFFLGTTYGTDVLKRLVETCERHGVERPVVIAHSSLKQASEALVENGADFLLTKVKGEATSPPLAHAFGSLQRIQWMKVHRQPMPEPGEDRLSSRQ